MAVSQRLRYEILRRDNHACRYCGATAPGVKLNVDHVIPQALGGSDDPTNLVSACSACNGGKTSSMPNAMPVADVDQQAFRESAELLALKRAALTDHLWRGGHPPQWGPSEIERYAVELAWNYAWAVATDGGSPTHEQHATFIDNSAELFERGRSVAELACAAVHAGSRLTPHLTWGLTAADMRYAPISGELFSRIDGAYDAWLAEWRRTGAPDPNQRRKDLCKGLLISAARAGCSRDSLLAGSRMAGARNAYCVDDYALVIESEGVPAGGGN
jgi:HNH endonuclease